MAFNANIILVIFMILVCYVAILLYAMTGYNEAIYRAVAEKFELEFIGNENADNSFDRDGLIFKIGNSYQLNNIVIGRGVKLCHLNYRALPVDNNLLDLATGYELSYYTTILCFDLPAPSPHLVLDARWDRFHSRSSLLPDCEKIKLEGDFPDYFTVMMQKGSSAESLSILSPEIMQQLISLDSTYSLELIGNQAIFILEQDQICDQSAIETLYQHGLTLLQTIGPRLLRMRD